MHGTDARVGAVFGNGSWDTRPKRKQKRRSDTEETEVVTAQRHSWFVEVFPAGATPYKCWWRVLVDPVLWFRLS